MFEGVGLNLRHAVIHFGYFRVDFVGGEVVRDVRKLCDWNTLNLGKKSKVR